MVYVKVDEEESFDDALKKFIRKLKDSGLQEELQKRRFHIPDTEKRRERRKQEQLTIKIANRRQKR